MLKSRKLHIGLLLAVCALAIAALVAAQLSRSDQTLDGVHALIVEKFPDVSHVSGEDLQARPVQDLILLDVREPDEFAVSHIEGAVRVPPGITADDLLAMLGETVKEKTVVLYCSVGMRSSSLASEVQAGLIERGAAAVYNLEGGLFRWHNQQRELVDSDDEATEFIHPFDAFWGRLIEREKLIKTKN